MGAMMSMLQRWRLKPTGEAACPQVAGPQDLSRFTCLAAHLRFIYTEGTCPAAALRRQRLDPGSPLGAASPSSKAIVTQDRTTVPELGETKPRPERRGSFGGERGKNATLRPKLEAKRTLIGKGVTPHRRRAGSSQRQRQSKERTTVGETEEGTEGRWVFGDFSLGVMLQLPFPVTGTHRVCGVQRSEYAERKACGQFPAFRPSIRRFPAVSAGGRDPWPRFPLHRCGERAVSEPSRRLPPSAGAPRPGCRAERHKQHVAHV